MDKEKDIFNEIIKNKLSNYSLPVDDDSWDKIEERLNSIHWKKTRRLWITTISIAASIALLFILFPFNKKVYNHETANQLSNHEEKIIQNVSEKETVQSYLQQNVENPTVFRKTQSGKQLAENELTAEVVLQNEITEENQNLPVKEEPDVQGNLPTLYVLDFDFGKEVKTPVIKNKKRRSISLSFGSRGNLLASNETTAQHNPYRIPAEETLSSELVYFKANVQDNNENLTDEILLNENYPDVIHYPPISVGITVKKDLTPTVAIESGIVYSFITTTFSRESSYKSKADLQLHYIGIPLNIHTRLFYNSKSQWGMYISTGGMVEKGILSHLIKKDFYDNNNSVMTISSNEKIKGLQWSVGISPGFDYQIYKNYSIYLEPKLSYYFDNDQPESARTEHPVTIGVNAGLRYTW